MLKMSEWLKLIQQFAAVMQNFPVDSRNVARRGGWVRVEDSVLT